ncbi:MerR family transcriptional regulator [Leucothrix pacifica]|nr:MerR family transcriptional regulator [Leucothrix pacifica]
MTTPAAAYEIGKASQLTGISTDKLRIWERRYAAVTPIRSGTGRRLYANADISRLKIIKTLIDGGDSISNVATLSLEELQSRVAEETQISQSDIPDGPIKIVTIGRSLSAKFSSDKDNNDDIELAASYNHPNSLGNETDIPKVDILIFENSALQEENVQQILDLMYRFNASHALVVYRFASQETLNRLPKSKCSILQAPVDINSIKDHCRSLFNKKNALMSLYDNDFEGDFSIAPARRYDDEALVKIAEISPLVKCECPQHLAELLFALNSFEKYSSECESLNLEDAELHAYLNNAAARARHIIENAMEKVIEAENIQI